tara:strand:+ start:3355 stop:4950 length:1596 start_codon:yes stop_codon:yes gene_type:complete
MAMPQFNLGQRWANISKTVGDIAQMQKSTAERKRAEKMQGQQMLQQTFKDVYGFADDWGKEQTRQRERQESIQLQKDLQEDKQLHDLALLDRETEQELEVMEKNWGFNKQQAEIAHGYKLELNSQQQEFAKHLQGEEFEQALKMLTQEWDYKDRASANELNYQLQLNESERQARREDLKESYEREDYVREQIKTIEGELLILRQKGEVKNQESIIRLEDALEKARMQEKFDQDIEVITMSQDFEEGNYVRQWEAKKQEIIDVWGSLDAYREYQIQLSQESGTSPNADFFEGMDVAFSALGVTTIEEMGELFAKDPSRIAVVEEAFTNREDYLKLLALTGVSDGTSDADIAASGLTVISVKSTPRVNPAITSSKRGYNINLDMLGEQIAGTFSMNRSGVPTWNPSATFPGAENQFAVGNIGQARTMARELSKTFELVKSELGGNVYKGLEVRLPNNEWIAAETAVVPDTTKGERKPEGTIPFGNTLSYVEGIIARIDNGDATLTNGEVQAARDWANMWEGLIESGSVKVKEG